MPANKKNKVEKRFLIRHLGNMGDMIFFVPPVLETLKKTYPHCHITFVTAWGFKKSRKKLRNWKLRNFLTSSLPPSSLTGESAGQSSRSSKKVDSPIKSWNDDRTGEFWGERNQGGFSIHLIMTNPHVDQLVHWHDTKLDLDARICIEDEQSFPTWNREYYEKQKKSGKYDAVYELDFGLQTDDNPLDRMYEVIGMPDETYSNYKIYLTVQDKEVAYEVMEEYPFPRIVLLEGIEGKSTRGWDPNKIEILKKEIGKEYGVEPIWFGGKHVRMHHGRPLTLRENIATLTYCDVGLGVMSGPMHFAAAVGLPTITLFGDQPLHRAAPAYFLNEYIADEKKKHRTILGATNCKNMKFLKGDTTFTNLTPAEAKTQGYKDWLDPGCQSTKSCVSVITVDEVMNVLNDMLS